MSILEMFIWLSTAVVLAYMIVGTYYLIKLIKYKLSSYLTELGVVNRFHVELGVWLVVIYVVCKLIDIILSAFV
ncbi:MAG: hypothetical protein ACRCVV_10745 [Shewanella sp.]